MISQVINMIRDDLKNSFGKVNKWLEINESLLNYSPQNGGWSIINILEHITITNHYLLILINKGTRKALELSKIANLNLEVLNYSFDMKGLELVGKHRSFEWNRPEHMEPTGNISSEIIKKRLQSQLMECIDCLDKMKNGEGVLYKTTMSVNKLGKIDVYHYIYFLVQHIYRHIEQMKQVKDEFEKKF